MNQIVKQINKEVEGFRKCFETESVIEFTANWDVKEINKKQMIAFNKIGKVLFIQMGMNDTRYPDDLRICIRLQKKVKGF